MANLKDDASTEIEAKVKDFAKDLTNWAKKWREDKLAQDPDAKLMCLYPEVKFVMSPNKKSAFRTPAQQALEITLQKSWMCWGPHMSDKARHVVMIVDGNAQYDGRDAKNAFGKDFPKFTKAWGELMKKHVLKNFDKGGDGWAGDPDPYHLELPDSRIKKTDERAKECVKEYLRLTREKGLKKNSKFEGKIQKDIEDYEKKAKK
jgi:hypothetical protein